MRGTRTQSTPTLQHVPWHSRQQVCEYANMLNSERNHRNYRLLVANMHPPILPLMPLLVNGARVACVRANMQAQI